MTLALGKQAKLCYAGVRNTRMALARIRKNVTKGQKAYSENKSIQTPKKSRWVDVKIKFFKITEMKILVLFELRFFIVDPFQNLVSGDRGWFRRAENIENGLPEFIRACFFWFAV
ncbi:hypothetical protein ACJX0J_032256 [Zea mays]